MKTYIVTFWNCNPYREPVKETMTMTTGKSVEDITYMLNSRGTKIISIVAQ